jgi:hypothetical protein
VIKKTWLGDWGNDLYVLAIRQYPNDLDLVHNTNRFPPIEKVDGKQLNIDQAKELGLVETHHTFGVFTIDDLIKLRTAIDEVLYER